MICILFWDNIIWILEKPLVGIYLQTKYPCYFIYLVIQWYYISAPLLNVPMVVKNEKKDLYLTNLLGICNFFIPYTK